MDSHLPKSFFYGADGDGIVKVLCIVRVNCKGCNITEILTAGHGCIGYFRGYFIGGLFNVLGIAVRESVFSQYRMHLSVVLTGCAENVYHFSDGVTVGSIRPFHNLYDRLLAVPSFLETAYGNENILVGFVGSYKVSKLTLDLKRTHKGILGPFDDFSDLTFGTGMRPACKQYYTDTVSVKGARRITLSHRYRITAVIGDQVVPASYTTLEYSFQELAFLHKLELTVLFIEETVLNQIQNYVQTHAAHRMSLELELFI